MRLLLPVVLFALATGLGAAPSHPERSPHSSNVLDARHEPSEPARGEAVAISVRLADTGNVSSVKAIYCRVKQYACGPSLTAQPTEDATYLAVIPWEDRFFRGVTRVGFQFEIRYQDGTSETSPIESYPSRPAELPEAGGHYYFYALPPEASVPATPFLTGALLFLVLAWRRT